MIKSLFEKAIKEYCSFNPKTISIAARAEDMLGDVFKKIDSIKSYNQLKVITSMQRHKLSESHFIGTTGYGYGDRGREILDLIYADVFGAEAALVRHNFVAGTHAIAAAMFGNLRPGDELLCVTGKPYDTLENVIGIGNEDNASLKDFGVTFGKIDVLSDGSLDLASLRNALNDRTKMVLIQRSPGYEWRRSVTLAEIKKASEIIKKHNNDIIILVDNCYGEFVEDKEPLEAGADLIAGSLIKNPGGGLALTGGYVAGNKKLVEMSASRLSCPGIGKEVGATLGQNRFMFQGLFMAPHVVAESLKGAAFCAAVMEILGFEVLPRYTAARNDIIQAIKFKNKDTLIAFCQGIQKGSAVDAHVKPEPWDMPGYNCQVIMASGGFVQGSSIELSADGPIRPPYIAYLQGGLVYEGVKLGVMNAVDNMLMVGKV